MKRSLKYDAEGKIRVANVRRERILSNKSVGWTGIEKYGQYVYVINYLNFGQTIRLL